MRRFWIVGLLTVFFACGGGDDRAPGIPPIVTGGKTGINTSGGGGSGGTAQGASQNGGGAGETGEGGEGAEPAEGGAGPGSTLAPEVEITSPAAIDDPNDGEVLTGQIIEVLCKAAKSSASGALAVDEASVKVALLDEDGKVQREIAGAPTEEIDVFSATFQLSQVESGVIKFRCSAGDKAAPAHVGSQTISTFLDRGPIITPVEPQPKSAHPLTGAVAFEFSVAAAPLADGDDGAEVTDVSLSVDGVDIETLAPAPKRPGVYVASVNFSDPLLFPMPPSGNIQVDIKASNSRTPTRAVRQEIYNFTLDGQAPVITITSPAEQRVLKDSLVLAFTISDPVSGVDPASIYVTLNSDEPLRFDLDDPDKWSNQGNNYTFSIDSSKIQGSISQVNVTVRASDLAGNGPATDSLFVNFDQLPPFISLAPPAARIVLKESNSTVRCSAKFDPVGSEAAKDLQIVPSFKMIRAFVRDRTAFAASQDIIYFAGVNPASVFFYVRSDGQPLIVDSGQDGFCDKLADDAKMLTGVVHLDPIKPQGAPNYAPSDVDYAEAPSVEGLNCSKQTNDHKGLCSLQNSDMEFAPSETSQVQSGATGMIYAPAVGSETSLQCAGVKVDLSNIAPDGWLCVAAVAADDVGNTGISRPIRICLDDETTPGSPPCATSSTEPPDCTDSCTPPSFSPAGDDSNGDPVPFYLLYGGIRSSDLKP